MEILPFAHVGLQHKMFLTVALHKAT